MKKLRLSALLLAGLISTSCSFYEEDESSIPETPSSSVEEESKEQASSSNAGNYLKVDCSGFPKVFDGFSAKALDGKTYDESMLKGKITLLNMWGTYCSPCVAEMPYLAKLHTKYEELDFQVVGIVIDVTDSSGNVVASQKTKADSIVKQTGVTYTSLYPCAGLASFINSTEYIPYSIFVDEHGHQLGKSYTGGMDLAGWEKAIKDTIYTYLY